MFWAELNRFKIKVYGEKSKIQTKNLSYTDDLLFLHDILRENGKILLNGKLIGIITSLTPDRSCGLGYVLRNFAEENREFETEKGKVVILKECLFKF